MAEFWTDIMVFFGCYESIRYSWIFYEEKMYGFSQTSDIHTIIALALTLFLTVMVHKWRNEEKVRKEVQK